MTRAGDLSVAEIATMLNGQAQALAASLFPQGQMAGGFYCVGSIEGERGLSLKIRVSGPRIGTWADYAKDRGEAGGTGDMLKLVEGTVCRGEGTGAAVQWAKRWLSLDSMDAGTIDKQRRRAAAAQARSEAASSDEAEKRRRSARGLWGFAAPMAGTGAAAYLEGRGISFKRLGHVPGALRFRHDCWNVELGRKIPAMVAAVMVPGEAQPIAVHRTFLEFGDAGWRKARVKEAKMALAPFGGGNIPLNKGACKKTLRDITPGTRVFVSEGIEDGLSVACADPSLRVVAAISLGNIGSLVLPEQIGGVTIICQRDAPGSDADTNLETQIGRLQERGFAVDLMWPEPGYKDFNDQMMGIRQSITLAEKGEK